ncbi:hypothetical protein [Candidatus Nitrosocosmicus franklandus]|uniref:Uncharacterized protein n=1 Tax=Candidatus Nitrosocosmicus franklandianus TaxID=1798806 RepID=A0A484I871_9ARCH|nr:hypothetical protein [Candidatus Nitrosocosmicus franklandus]VFJ12943.1 protein of unknown function [Candidatus Nitrosocosmicus franklandus]
MSLTDFKVVPVTETYKGKTYSQWIAHWTNWFFMPNPDQYNSQPWNDVKFLTSFPSPHEIAQLGNPGERVRYEGSEFQNIPNIKTGENRLVMYDDQAIFFPVILAMWVNSDDKDYGYMERYVKIQNSMSDDPPGVHQFTLDSLPLLPSDEVINHRIMSDGLFQVHIPDATYGTSLKDFVAEPSPPGTYGAVCEGYFFMLKNLMAREEPYLLTSFATGAPYVGFGEYHASFVYEIKVFHHDLKPRAPQTGKFPERILKFIEQKSSTARTGQDISESIYSITESLDDFRKANKAYTLLNKSGKKDAQKYAISMLVLGNVKRKIPAFIRSRKRPEKIELETEKINSIVKHIADSIVSSSDNVTQSSIPESQSSQEQIDGYLSIIRDALEEEKRLVEKDKKSVRDQEIINAIDLLLNKIEKDAKN